MALPKEVGNMSSLTTLDLWGCSNMIDLPKEVRNCSSFITLDLSRYSSLALPKELGNLSYLNTLEWRREPFIHRQYYARTSTLAPGSILLILIFVTIVLFLGSHVWIKSRQASVPGGVYRRAVKDTRGSVTHYKYEPRFKPRREKLESGASLEFNNLPLGSYDTPREAAIVRNIAAVLYGKEEGRPVQFEDGLCLPFPSVTEPEKCPPSGKEKACWVTHKSKELYAKLLEGKASRLQLLHLAVETVSHQGYAGEASHSDPSPSAPGAGSTAIELTCVTSSHGGNGVEERATSESHGLGQEAPTGPQVFSAFFSDFDFEQVNSSMPQWEEHDFPAMDDLDKIADDFSATDNVFGLESTLLPPLSTALDIPEVDGGDQGFETIEPRLNSATAIAFPQSESRPEQVQLQLRLTCQEKCPEDFAGSNVELQQKLLESEVRILELQQQLRKYEDKNEKWKSMFRRWTSVFRQLASASHEDGSPVDISEKF